MKKLLASLMACMLLIAPVTAWATDENHGAQPAADASVAVVSLNPADYALPLTDVPLGIQEGEAVKSDFFDDAVFVGDSISLKLHHYVKKQRQTDAEFMGEARFLVSGSLGSGNALWEISKESVHPSYQGDKMLIEDAVARMGAEKVYIMLGANDVGMYGVDGSVENMKTLIGRIVDKSPDAEIYVQSATPRIAAMKSKPTNRQLFEYNLALYGLCVEEGWNFVDVASVMRDEYGNLPDDYCSDAPTMGMHFTDEACQVWIDYLMTHAK